MLSSTLLIVLAALTVVNVAGGSLNDSIVARLAKDLSLHMTPDDDYEIAAFAVRAADGSVSLVFWSDTRRFHGAQWSGRLPDGVVAVLHTHPYRSPLPSLRDAAEARRLGLPFYVVSRGALSVVEPDGRVHRARILPWRLAKDKMTVVSLSWQELMSLG